jgi:hypothetical protein
MNSEIRPKQKERGQSMVELALTITILMLLLAGTIDLGRAFFTWLGMRDAAQEGASYGSIEPCDIIGINARISANLDQIIRPPEVYTVLLTIPDPASLGDTIQVDITYPKFPITVPLLGTIIGDEIPIHATVNDTILVTCN